MGHNNSSHVAQIQEQFDDLSYTNSDSDTDHTVTTSVPAQDFPRFLELATEIQIQIWHQAILACPGAHELGTISFLFITPRWVGTRSPRMLISPYTKRIVYGHSFVYKDRKDLYSLMGACRLSRQMVLEWWMEKLLESPRGYNAEKKETKERMVDVLGELLGQMRG